MKRGPKTIVAAAVVMAVVAATVAAVAADAAKATAAAAAAAAIAAVVTASVIKRSLRGMQDIHHRNLCHWLTLAVFNGSMERSRFDPARADALAVFILRPFLIWGGPILHRVLRLNCRAKAGERAQWRQLGRGIGLRNSSDEEENMSDSPQATTSTDRKTTEVAGSAGGSSANGRKWWWVLAVAVVALVIYGLNRSTPSEETQAAVEFDFVGSGAAKSGAAGGSGSPDAASADAATPVVRGGITDLLNEHPIDRAVHPLDPLLLVAQRGLDLLRGSLRDYTAVLERQERVGQQLMPAETIVIKIRQALTAEQNNGQAVARAIYTRHEAPSSLQGQEAIYVAGENDGNVVAHTTGLLNIRRFYLPPTGFLAMRGNRYPMTEAGFEVLIERMLERGRRDRDFGPCEVRVDRQATVNGRACTVFEIVHPQPEGPYDFHIAQIAIDDQLNLPIHYASYTWPTEPGGKPELLERYTYTDIVINPGLPTETFRPDNPAYQFPSK